ncbi:MAG: FG-GAP-like repeat-containing protein [Rhodomicrobium sp.]
MRIRKTGQKSLEQTDIFDSEAGLNGAFTLPSPGRAELAWNGAGTGVVATVATGNQDIDGLLYTQHWGTLNVTFGFPVSASQYGAYPTGETSTFQPVNAQMANVARWALTSAVGSSYSAVSQLALTENTGSPGAATIRIGMSNSSQPTAYAYYPSAAAAGGDVWMGTQAGYDAMTNPVRGGYAFDSMMHELGHALGLKHGQETGGVANVAMTAAHDDMEYSIMTYLSYLGGPTTGYTNEEWGFAQSPMMYDIAAIQSMYGARYSSGHTYSWSPATGQEFIDGVGQAAPGGNRVFMTVWDGGAGSNGGAYDLSNYATNLSIDLTPGGFSVLSSGQLAYLGNGHYAQGNVYNALLYNGNVQSEINNCYCGSGNDTIKLTGDNVNNLIDGGGGVDTAYVTYNFNSGYTLSGTSSLFTMTGSAGADTLKNIEYVHFANGSTLATSSLLSSDTVAGAGDFNADGYLDLVGRNSGGGVIVWDLNNTQTLSKSSVTQNGVTVSPGSYWTVAGTGDFNNDGCADILLRGTGGEITIWDMNNNRIVDGGSTTQNGTAVNPGHYWAVAGTGDFDHDGYADILLRGTGGEVTIWDMNSNRIVGGGSATQNGTKANLGSYWTIAGTGDFNHDGYADILWSGAGGEVSIWDMNNNQVIGGGAVTLNGTAANTGTYWKVAGTGDFNHDGYADILLRGAGGESLIWNMNNTQISGKGTLSL